jgi:2-keto-4-pentenoate hydratase/2-oxohepta-3-ene-1,7-dioic acid hydratase in catechol pathway
MKLVTFTMNGVEGVGALLQDNHTIADLKSHGVANSLAELIDAFSENGNLPSLDGAPRVPLKDVELLAPLPRPRRNIFCVGKNYLEHAAEFGGSGYDGGSLGGDEIPAAPIIFSKPPSSVTGPGAPVDSKLDPEASVDYEAEVAVIIGKRGRVAPDADPMSFVFGYTIMNDVTSRELQKRHKQWLLGKGIDTFAPMGPAIVTADEVPDPSKLEIKLWVNGELRQSADLSQLIFDVPHLIRTIGASITLEPGDIIATGTPAGVGVGFKPPRYLEAGDVVRIEVPSIGILENPII